MSGGSNIRPAPAFFTADLVKRVLEQAQKPRVVGKPIPVVQVPTRGVKPKLAIVEQSNESPAVGSAARAEESEAVVPAASLQKQRNKNHPHNEARKREFEEQLEAELPFIRIAHARGIALADLARTLGLGNETMRAHARRAGFSFGARPLLAQPLSREQLLRLADASVALPELREDRAYRDRLARQSKAKRERRVEARRNDPSYRPLGSREEQRARIAAIVSRSNGADGPTPQGTVEVAQPTVARAPKPKPPRISAAELAPCPNTASAHPIPRPQPRGIMAYAEAISKARAFLQSRHFTVRRDDADQLIARWKVSGVYGVLTNEQLIAFAQKHGMEALA